MFYTPSLYLLVHLLSLLRLLLRLLIVRAPLSPHGLSWMMI